MAREFAKALDEPLENKRGYMESDSYIVTWCVGHLVTMSYPEKYDPRLKSWNLSELPFIPEVFKYEVIDNVKDQFKVVSGLFNRSDVERIYVCTDAGREGEYIFRLVDDMAGRPAKDKRRVWIDSQTEEEIHRGIREAKPLSAYDNLAHSAYLRAKEDYLMGINFSRLLTLKYGNSVTAQLGKRFGAIAVGRVMTCVQGMVVAREREIRDFQKTPFYRVFLEMDGISAEWKENARSVYKGSPLLYKDNGFKEEKTAKALIALLKDVPEATVLKATKKTENKNPPLLYNLAELQNECSRIFKISPDETLKAVQTLYEKKLVTYPRTDARVLSSAVAKEISKNLNGLMGYTPAVPFLKDIVKSGSYKKIGKTRYTDDTKITDHYAIIPTGEGLRALQSVGHLYAAIYDRIVHRFLSIFYPKATYTKFQMVFGVKDETFHASIRNLADPGYLLVADPELVKKQMSERDALPNLKKGEKIPVKGYSIKEGETSPPKRYNSGSLILAMENAGQLIEDDELREQIKGCGIGTSATRAEILKKLVDKKYLSLNTKTQIITPTLLGEVIADVVDRTIPSLLDPRLTASWEKGLAYMAEGTITEEDYMQKLSGFIIRRTAYVKNLSNQYEVREAFSRIKPYYR